MIEKIRTFIIENNLINSTTPEIIVAVSGGIDSCVLLDILVKLQPDFTYNLKIIHLNHRVRGKASDDDEMFVISMAKKYNLIIEHSRLSAGSKKKTETYLREKRYQYFNEVLANHPGSVIATGHHMDDLVETFIMRLMKGSRLKGLLSIIPKRDRFIRPMLAVGRKEIEQYAQENEIQYKQDLTNLDTVIQRNLVRHKILPYLESELDKNIKENLVKIIKEFTYHYQIYDEQIKDAVNHSVIKSNKTIILNKEKYDRFNPVIRRGLIEYCISLLYPLNYSISDPEYKLLNEFIKNAQTGKIFTLKKGFIAFAERENIIFGFPCNSNKEKYVLNLSNAVSIGDKYRIRMTLIDKKDVKYNLNRNIEFINGDKSGDNLIVRFWQTGDRFMPLGMEQYRKLSDFFIDLKINRYRKREIPIVCARNKIIWIAGYRLDGRFKVSEKTAVIYKLELEKLHK